MKTKIIEGLIFIAFIFELSGCDVYSSHTLINTIPSERPLITSSVTSSTNIMTSESPQVSNSLKNTETSPIDVDDSIPTVIANPVDTNAFNFKQMTYEDVVKKYGHPLKEYPFEGALLAKFNKYVLAFNGDDFPIEPSEKVTSVSILHNNEVLDGVSIGKSFQSINNALGGKLLQPEEGEGFGTVFKYNYKSEKVFIWLNFDLKSYTCDSIDIFFKDTW